MQLAVLIPAHDEAAILEANATRVWQWMRKEFGKETALVLSENGSSDATAEIARELEARLPGVIALSSERAGKGGAIKRAAAKVGADTYLMLDADLSANLGSAATVVRAVRYGIDLAVGSRRVMTSLAVRPRMRQLATAAYAFAAQASLGLGIRDLQCGCKAFSRRVRDGILPEVRDDGWFFDTELIAKARRSGVSIAEIGVRWSDGSRDGPGKLKLFSTGLSFMRKLAELRRETRS
jgi:glycosyltransferase involved in cell wall biosynthesis